jgi:N4-gp56 family major capsid protein
MPFTTAMTTVASVDDSIVQAYDAAFIVAAEQGDVMSPFVQYRADIGAKSIEFPKYGKLGAFTTPLTEDEDVASTALVDSKILFTPVEYGGVVTVTALASLQTGGRVDLAAARLVGDSVGKTINVLAIRALEASTNLVLPGAVAGESTLAAGDVMSAAVLNKVYNKLARASVPALADGLYVAFMHDDVIADIRATAAAGDWTDVVKYARPEDALRNEVGVYKGFRIVRNNDCVFADQTGAGTVDAYKSSFLGFNGLGLAVSKAPGMVITQSDKLNRFVNMGWHGVMKFGIVDTDAVWTAFTASSLGANAT